MFGNHNDRQLNLSTDHQWAKITNIYNYIYCDKLMLNIIKILKIFNIMTIII